MCMYTSIVEGYMEGGENRKAHGRVQIQMGFCPFDFPCDE